MNRCYLALHNWSSSSFHVPEKTSHNPEISFNIAVHSGASLSPALTVVGPGVLPGGHPLLIFAYLFLPSLSSEDRENMPIGVGQLTIPEEPMRKDQSTTAPQTSVVRRGSRLPRFPLEDAPQVDVGRWETWTFWRVEIQRLRCGNICRDVNTPHLFFTPFHEGLREQSNHKDRGT